MPGPNSMPVANAGSEEKPRFVTGKTRLRAAGLRSGQDMTPALWTLYARKGAGR